MEGEGLGVGKIGGGGKGGFGEMAGRPGMSSSHSGSCVTEINN